MTSRCMQRGLSMLGALFLAAMSLTHAAPARLALLGQVPPAPGAAPATATGATSVALPPGEGKELVARACAQCHSLETVLRSRLTRQQWEARIDQMVAKGAKLSDDEIDVVATYLAKNFGPT